MRVPLLLLCCQELVAIPLTQSTESPTLQEGQKKFTTNLLQLVESSTLTNFVLSPHSIHSTFSQLLQGSGGRTQAELESVLGVEAGQSLGEEYRMLGAALARGSSTLREANLVAVAQGFKPQPGYRSSLIRGFSSDFREFDFGGDTARSVEDINQYVADNTNNKIVDLISEGDVDSLTRMILVNAVYFKANWKFAFPPWQTFQFDFHSPTGIVRSPSMNMDAEVRVLEDTARQLDILELPYDDPSKSMLIVLPNSGVSSDRITERMAGLELADVRKNGRLADTTITIPKFKLKFQTFLSEKMNDLGVRDLFTGRANLTGVSSEPLSVSAAVHQAFIEVNEEGTEAAAATGVVLDTRSSDSSWQRQFRADRPFLFVVYDVPRDTVLFAGKVVDPSTDTIIQGKAAMVQENPVDFLPQKTSQPETLTTLNNLRERRAVTVGEKSGCERLFRDFPNSLDNSAICQKVATEGKRFDWLRNNRGLCEESKDFFDYFIAKSCGQWWCEQAASLVSSWRVETASSLCVGNRVETVETKKACKNIQNKLKALDFLQCALPATQSAPMLYIADRYCTEQFCT